MLVYQLSSSVLVQTSPVLIVFSDHPVLNRSFHLLHQLVVGGWEIELKLALCAGSSRAVCTLDIVGQVTRCTGDVARRNLLVAIVTYRSMHARSNKDNNNNVPKCLSDEGHVAEGRSIVYRSQLTRTFPSL